MYTRDVHTRDVHTRDVHTRDVHTRDAHMRDVHTRDVSDACVVCLCYSVEVCYHLRLFFAYVLVGLPGCWESPQQHSRELLVLLRAVEQLQLQHLRQVGEQR